MLNDKDRDYERDYDRGARYRPDYKRARYKPDYKRSNYHRTGNHTRDDEDENERFEDDYTNYGDSNTFFSKVADVASGIGTGLHEYYKNHQQKQHISMKDAIICGAQVFDSAVEEGEYCLLQEKEERVKEDLGENGGMDEKG